MKQRFIPLFTALGLFGCAAAPEALLDAASPDAIAQVGPVETYELSGGGVRVEADVKAGSAYTIRFPRVSGALVLSPDVPEASSVDLTIDTTSAEASWDLVADIARDKFLHVGTHPEARFVSTALRKAEEGKYTMYGELTFHGTTKSLATPVKVELDPCAAKVHIEFSIDRRAFGAIAEGGIDGLVSDSVVVRVLADVKRKACEGKALGAQARTDP